MRLFSLPIYRSGDLWRGGGPDESMKQVATLMWAAHAGECVAGTGGREGNGVGAQCTYEGGSAGPNPLINQVVDQGGSVQ